MLLDLKKGKEAAFRYCYTEYLPVVRSWLMRNGCISEDADDLFQEALLVLYDKVRKDDFDLYVKLSTYLMSIAKYMWYNRQRKVKSNREVQWSEVDAAPEEMMENDLEYFLEQEKLYQKLESALDELGSPCKEVLEAFYMDNMSMEDISKLMDYTNANNAKTQKYKCLNRLKKIFNKAKDQDEQIRTL